MFKSLFIGNVDFNHKVHGDYFYIRKKRTSYQRLDNILPQIVLAFNGLWRTHLACTALLLYMRLSWTSRSCFTPHWQNPYEPMLFQHTATFNINLQALPSDAPQSMSTINRYHYSVRSAFNIISSGSSTLDNEVILQFSVNAGNYIVVLNESVPITPVYISLTHLRLSTEHPSLSLYHFTRAVCMAINDVTWYFAMKYQLCHSNVAATKTLDFHKLPFSTHVLVYWPKTDLYEGPLELLHKFYEYFSNLMSHETS